MRITNRPLFYWVLNRFRGFQVILLLVIVISLFFRVYPLEMQRQIINVAINLKMLDKLYLYCGLYMGAVLIAGLLKYLTNTMQAILGQKILVGMRQELYQHILQLPLPFFHRTQAGTIISTVTAELNAITTFLGNAVAVPVTTVLTFTTFLGFMIYLNPTLGLLSMIIYPFELTIIPLLQRRYNTFNRKRVMTSRQITSLVNESVTGIHEVQGNASYLLEHKKLTRLIKRLYSIMKRLSIIKYGIKFSNNLFQSIGPFLLFLVGGYLAINGEFTIGALVAFLSAYEKVYDPWKELIEYYQTYQDAQVRYKQIMELLDYSPDFLLEAPAPPVTLSGSIEATNIDYRISDSIQLLNDVSFHLESGKHLALVGFSGSGKSTLSLLISQLLKCSSGTLKIGGRDISSLSKLEAALNISSVAQHPFIFTGSVRENLLYSCKTLHLNKLIDDIPDRAAVIDMVKEVGLADDVIRWGLRTVITPKRAEPMIGSFLKMRQIIQEKLREKFEPAIEFYNATEFQQYLPIAKNIIFGSYGGAFSNKKLIDNKEFRVFLSHRNLDTPLTRLGLDIAIATIEFLGDFRNDAFFFQGSPMKPESFQNYEKLVNKVRTRSLEKLKPSEQDIFLLLALDFTPGIHKISSITTAFEEEILSARKAFLEQVAGVDLDQCSNGTIQLDIKPYTDVQQPSPESEFTPFCVNQYLNSLTLGDNILFGTVIDRDLIRDQLGQIARKEFELHGLMDDVMDIGLDFHVGSKGDNLSGGQKQKIALARALLKKSPILILDEATASLDNSSQAQIQRYIDTRLKGNTTVVSVVHRLDMISGYDHIIVMKDGKIVESGTYPDLVDQKGTLYDLINDSK